MKYSVRKISLQKRREGGMTIAGQENNGDVIVLKLKSMSNFMLPVESVVIFPGTDQYEFLKPLLDEAADHELKDQDIPKEIGELNGITEVIPIEPHCRKYSENILQNGNIVHAAGTIICTKAGTPKVYTSISVFCLRYKDEDTGDWRFMPGWDPQTRASQQLSAYYIGLPSGSDVVEPEIVEPENQETNVTKIDTSNMSADQMEALKKAGLV